MSNREQVALRLDLIAAKAKQLATDSRNGRLWGGDMYQVLDEIKKQVQAAQQESRDDR